jgi:dipeptidyl aminopeptidase/acylaminoacyl peptidase
MAEGSERRSRRGWVIGGLVVVGVIAVFVYGVASFVVYDGVGKAPQACWPNDREHTPAAFKVPGDLDGAIAGAYAMSDFQEVRFASRDPQIRDAELAAWWIPAGSTPEEIAAAPAVVLVHGAQSCRREASVLLAAGMLHQAGYSVFLMDLRDHGDSEGDDARFAGGSEEHLDVLGGWDWVRAQGVPTDRIGLAGFSFGSISAIVAGSQEPQVAAVWADSPTTTMSEGIGNFLADQLHDGTGLSKVLVPGALLWAKVVAGDDLTRFDPITEVTRYSGRDIAFAHGAADAVLPARMSQDLQAAATASGARSPDAWIVPDAKHTQEIYVAPDEYRERLVGFFDQALGQP